MSLNAIMRWLKPRETVFFDLLEASSVNVLGAAQLFDKEIRTNDPTRWAELRRQMKDFEHKGDQYTHEIIDHLNKTFVTPIEREDILALASALDDVADRLDSTCERLVLYRMGITMPAVQELSSIIVEGAGELVHLIKHLRTMSDQKDIQTRIRHCHALENQADSIYHSALAQIFEDPKDAIELIKWKELLAEIEDATDRIEDVAQVVGSTVMRNA
jgi:predicted phosphate transport protein (TIGR00153 family)